MAALRLRFDEDTLWDLVWLLLGGPAMITGFIWFGFLIAHMAGNLGAFLGRQHFNEYAHHLRELEADVGQRKESCERLYSACGKSGWYRGMHMHSRPIVDGSFLFS